jgi:hypothetical protein
MAQLTIIDKIEKLPVRAKAKSQYTTQQPHPYSGKFATMCPILIYHLTKLYTN